MNVKAIETRYKGHRFRSRREARWAVFMDALGIAWEYEPEGYDLGPVGPYLPDFWLPDYERFMEIKAQIDRVTPEEWARAKALAAGTGKVVLVFYECAPAEMVLTWPSGQDCSPETSFRGYGSYADPDGEVDGMMAFGFCRRCNQPTIGFAGAHWLGCARQYEGRKPCWGDTLAKARPAEHPMVIRAFKAARSARFEHGQSIDPWKD